MKHVPCESCDNHTADYWVEFSSRYGGTSGGFAVCWTCMADARRGPRPPSVRILAETA